MGWLNDNVKTDFSKESGSRDAYGTTTPIVSDQYGQGFNALSGSIGTDGFNNTQRDAAGKIRNMLDNPSYRYFTEQTNNALSNISNAYGGLVNEGPYLLGAAPTISAKTAADFMDLYKEDYTRDVTDAALADYDAGAAVQKNNLRAANAGAFGNKRYGVAEGQFAADAARGRGSLSANLLAQGFRDRAALGAGDAGRALEADTTTAQIRDSRDKFNVNSQYQAQANAAQYLKEQSGLSQQILDNIVTADGIDAELAQTLFAAGTISQSQLHDILDAAREYNGSQFTENVDTNRTKFGINTELGFG